MDFGVPVEIDLGTGKIRYSPVILRISGLCTYLLSLHAQRHVRELR